MINIAPMMFVNYRTMKSGIYCIENLVNGKKYIGQSTDLQKREKRHFINLKGGYHYNSHLQNSYNKYGKENFEFKVLIYCEPFELTRYEQFFVNKHDRYILYNICLECVDSTLGVYHSEESKKKMSKSHSGVISGFKGKKHTKQSRNKISKNHSDVSGKNNPMWGKKHSKKVRRKMSENHPDVSGEKNPMYGADLSGKNNPMYGVRLFGKDNGFYGKRHSKETIKKLSGENGSNSILKKEQVLQILDLYYNKQYTGTKISHFFPVTEGSIYNIIKGKTWKDCYKDFMKNYKG